MKSKEQNPFWINKTFDELFSSIDIDEDGYISKSDMRKSFAINQVPISEQLLNSIFELGDITMNNKISKYEFEIYTAHQNKKILELFEEMNVNKTVELNLQDIADCLQKFDPSYKNLNIMRILKRLDTNKSGTVSVNDLMTFYHLIPVNNIQLIFSTFEREGFDIGETITLNGDFIDETKSKEYSINCQRTNLPDPSHFTLWGHRCSVLEDSDCPVRPP
jgi:Ca2+-binding EF-hand superfamily protein